MTITLFRHESCLGEYSVDLIISNKNIGVELYEVPKSKER